MIIEKQNVVVHTSAAFCEIDSKTKTPTTEILSAHDAVRANHQTTS
jgi:hypothetical protein